jgi:mono/diheme cytochrome c family protein
MFRWPILACVLLSAAAFIFAACETDKSHWTDAQLRLTAQQAEGRKVYDSYCSACHAAYTSKKLNGPSLKELYKKRAMPSGAPPTDERIAAVIMRGRRTMPGFESVLEQKDIDALLAYLHTL